MGKLTVHIIIVPAIPPARHNKKTSPPGFIGNNNAFTS
jgi:hypothetical protein